VSRFIPVTSDDVKAYREKLLADLEPQNFMEDTAVIAGAVGFWLQKLADGNRAVAQARLEREKAAASIRDYAVSLLQNRGVKVTEDAIQGVTLQDSAYLKAAMGVINAEHARDSAQAVADAVQARLEMLVNRGAHIRREIKADTSTFN
jgi:hypothetical protein